MSAAMMEIDELPHLHASPSKSSKAVRARQTLQGLMLSSGQVSLAYPSQVICCTHSSCTVQSHALAHQLSSEGV
jgi:hypothetical protein